VLLSAPDKAQLVAYLDGLWFVQDKTESEWMILWKAQEQLYCAETRSAYAHLLGELEALPRARATAIVTQALSSPASSDWAEMQKQVFDLHFQEFVGWLDRLNQDSPETWGPAEHSESRELAYKIPPSMMVDLVRRLEIDIRLRLRELAQADLARSGIRAARQRPTTPSPKTLADPVVIDYLAAVQGLDDHGWARLLDVGDATFERSSAVVKAVGAAASAWASPRLGPPTNPFAGLRLDGRTVMSVMLPLHDKAEEVAGLAWAKLHPMTPMRVSVVNGETRVTGPSDDEIRSRTFQGTRPKAIASAGALLISISGLVPDWDRLWSPWEAVIDGAPRRPLFIGQWGELIEIPPVAKAGGIRSLFARGPFGESSPAVASILRQLDAAGPREWERLKALAADFMEAMSSIAEPLALRAVATLADTENRARFGDDLLVQVGRLSADGECRKAGLDPAVLRAAFNAGSSKCPRAKSWASAEEILAGALPLCLVSSRGVMQPDAWQRVWGSGKPSQQLPPRQSR